MELHLLPLGATVLSITLDKWRFKIFFHHKFSFNGIFLTKPE